MKKPIKVRSCRLSGVRSKAGWRTIGGKKCYFRSLSESNYARFLEWQRKLGCIKDWEHEPQTFWFEGIRRGCVSYLPDFKIICNDDTHFWVEVKGYMDPKSQTKIRRFRKYFPKEELQIVDMNWFKKNGHLSKVIMGWE
jgi:hypothetical protein